ncbi:family 10 glycosylhydrolase [Candidatus Bathyarchaeota archaeon]|nr:family 10 glycosylhydrolase [Candidatus Bathyarchaeota archaeon]
MALILITITGISILSPVISSSLSSVAIKSTGQIVATQLFDNCDSAANWKVGEAKNTLGIDTVDKVEGTASLKMTFAATGSNWGGLFYREPADVWDFSAMPLLRMRFKASDQMPANFKFCIVTATEQNPDDWIINTYSILDKITVIDSWIVIDFDLRFPENYVEWPDLRYIKQIGFQCWDEFITNPVTFRVDRIERMVGALIPLEAYVKPNVVYLIVNDSISFQVFARGGIEPYYYAWYLDNQIQPQTSATFTYKATTLGLHEVKAILRDSNVTSLTLKANVTVIEASRPIQADSDIFKSDIRGVFLHTPWGYNPQWNVIADTCLSYGINTIVIETYTSHFWSGSGIVDFQELRTAITAFHNKGLSVHVLLCVALTPDTGMKAKNSAGATVDWLCFTKNVSKTMLKAVAESLARDYDIDGLMFDYIRWDTENGFICFCNECKARFIVDTGLTDVNWPADCLPSGRYYWDFIQWRCIPVTEAMRDMRNAMLAINPNLLFSAAVWPAFQDCGNYWVEEIGQHTADWVDKGYLDFVSPMVYTTTLTGTDSVDQLTRNSRDFYVGGSEGKIPLVVFTTIDIDGSPRNINNFVEATRLMRNNGADGWIIWRYGGPGLTAYFDVRPYLGALQETGLMEPIWTIQNLTVSINPGRTAATISWTTTVPTKSRIEYANHPLFNATVRYDDFGRPIYYKDIDYVGGTIQENTTLKTTHSFTILITDETRFRIQCIDANNITITSKEILVLATSP